MPKLPPSPPALIERFDEVAARHPAAQRRKMFGYAALFVGGNLATSLFADRWVVRMAPADTEALRAVDGAEPFSPAPGRSMTGWTLLPRELVDDDAGLDAWLGRAFAFAASLPAKD
jgi:TfoX/Sxy family transcriptional regulator of competence genes